ncbi:hypothetical protein [Sphingobium sp.]|uniref:hypothetical protein n=1 Tax=Sphingobium sp. TaxID=1912891 RepID=UPI0026135699|nr:hypothetical protein [Sphingobium sp.]
MRLIVFGAGLFALIWLFQNGGGPILGVILLLIISIPCILLIVTAKPKRAGRRQEQSKVVQPNPRDLQQARRKRPKKKVSARQPRGRTLPVTVMIENEKSLSPRSIEEALDALPESIRRQSGSLFYTGRDAFTKPSAIYVLGLNPGGDPDAQEANTIEVAIKGFKTAPARWSAYKDDSWEGAPPGTWGLQPRVLHFFKGLGLDPQTVPASNVIFVRSTTEGTLALDKDELITACWPVHEAVIRELGISMVICLGATAGKWVREQVGADVLIEEFRETNARGWKSQAHRRSDGFTVVTLSHPGRADWRNPAADPTPFVKAILDQHGSKSGGNL